MKILHVVGARPNFPKVAPVMAKLAEYPARFTQFLIHTGQHYDYEMSEIFFEHLGIRHPDEFLNVGSASHAVQTAAIMTAFEPIAIKHKPDWVFVVGDVNSTLACALVCSKLGIPVAHVEAGLRSRDRTMPEEINRVLTDQVSDLLFTPSRDAGENLQREGIDPHKICFVGNVMIDTLIQLLPSALQRQKQRELHLQPKNYVLVTLHRPSNVDNNKTLVDLLRALADISRDIPVIFPVHPRTRQRIQDINEDLPSTLKLISPLGYLDFLSLTNDARLVVTDSGGVQEETTYLGVACVTVRPNTERPITITNGTNRLVGSRYEDLLDCFRQTVIQPACARKPPELWDGQAASRIAQIMLNL
ncbi:MAG TPA: UDP-N-acetylglucosamine 2-epimerase (non-hydrolyzing) [Chthoniobacterales bacterium]